MSWGSPPLDSGRVVVGLYIDMISTLVHSSGPHSYEWHISQQQKRLKKKRALCPHERVISFCACCKVNMATGEAIVSKDWGARRIKVDRE